MDQERDIGKGRGQIGGRKGRDQRERETVVGD